MLMFRMIIFLYELKHAKVPESPIDTISYFFLLPNYCFLLFPVVDYRTMQRGYFAADVHAIQGRGLAMMFRGTLHLLAYRLVYHELLIAPGEVQGLEDLIGHVVCNYLLYLQRLGPVPHGLRHAAPLRLPAPGDAPPLPAGDELHRLLAADQHLLEGLHGPDLLQPGGLPAEAVAAADGAGGGDGRGVPGDLAAARLPVVLAARELGLHGARRPVLGHPGRPGRDQRAARRPPARRRGGGRPRATATVRPPGALAVRAAKVAGTFTTIALLWSLWSSPSLGAWLDMIGRGLRGSWSFPRLWRACPTCSAEGRMGHDPLMGRQLLATLAILACGLVPDRLAGAGPARLRASLTSGLFNRTDASRIERGYYEQLLDTGQRLDDLGDLPALRGRRRVGGTFGAPVNSAPLVIRVDDLREVVLQAVRRRRDAGACAGAPTPRGCATASTPSTSRPARSASRWWATRSPPAGASTSTIASSRSSSATGTSGRGARAGPRSRSSTPPCRAMRPASAGTTSSGSAGRCGPTW